MTTEIPNGSFCWKTTKTFLIKVYIFGNDFGSVKLFSSKFRLKCLHQKRFYRFLTIKTKAATGAVLSMT